MSSRHFLFVIGAHVLRSKTAVGGDSPISASISRLCALRFEGQYSKLIEITPDQWRFLRGVYAMNAEAPPGLPCGDDVVLAQGGGDFTVCCSSSTATSSARRCTRRPRCSRSWRSSSDDRHKGGRIDLPNVIVRRSSRAGSARHHVRCRAASAHSVSEAGGDNSHRCRAHRSGFSGDPKNPDRQLAHPAVPLEFAGLQAVRAGLTRFSIERI